MIIEPNSQLSGDPLAMEDPSSRYKLGYKRGGPLFKIKGERLYVTNMVSEPIIQEVLAWKDDTRHDFQASNVSDGRI